MVCNPNLPEDTSNRAMRARACVYVCVSVYVVSNVW